MNLIIFLVIGAVAGWLAGMVFKKNFGLLVNILLGIVGGFIGGYVFDLLNVTILGANIDHFITAFVGAVILLWISSLLKK